MNKPRHGALVKRIDELLALDRPADPTGWMRYKLLKDMLFPTRSAEALIMSGANPLEGLVHDPVTCVKLSSHAIQYILPFAVVICTMAGFANEKNTEIELDTVVRLQGYREVFRDIVVGDIQVMNALACMTKPLSAEERESSVGRLDLLTSYRGSLELLCIHMLSKISKRSIRTS